MTAYFPKPEIIAPIIAHRGISQRAPENTLASFKLALAESVRWIECDVQKTADDEFVIFHDTTLHRIAKNELKISEMNSESINFIDAGSWFSNDYVDEKIPTLKSVMEFVIEHDMYINLELKLDTEENQEIWVRRFVDCITKYSEAMKRILISSFSRSALTEVRKRLHEMPLALNEENIGCDSLDYLNRYSIGGYHLYHKNLNQHIAELCTKNEIDLRLYTINSIEQLLKCLRIIKPYRLAGIFSDCPEVFM